MATSPPRSGVRLRRVVVALAGAEVALLLGLLALLAPSLFAGEAIVRDTAQAAIVLAAVPLIALALPALVLALRAWALKIALTLALLVFPVGAALVLFA